MKEKINPMQSHQHDNAKIILISVLIGIVAGLVAVLYRFALTEAEHVSFAIYAFVTENKAYIPLLFLALAGSGYLIGRLTARFPLISGSGIPQVKAHIMGYFSGSWLGTLIVKFFGGTLAILGGLSLGREGPSIQLGACVGQAVGEKFACSPKERRIYMASGASAGLAAAFNAPLAGVMFALEEIFKYFSPMVLLSTMVAAVTADFVSKLFFGISHVFAFKITHSIPMEHYWLLLVLGVILGLSGTLYNVCIVHAQRIYRDMKWLNPKLRPIIPFIVAGVLGLTFPIVLCGGHSVIEELHISTSILLLLSALVVKFLFSMVSFGSGAPGGIFFPLLVLGSTIGAIFAQIIIPLLGLDNALFYNFVIIGMAGYFTAIVRAPLTGIILLVEMTGTLSQLLPLIITSAVAYIVAEELHNKPIYESLLENLLKSRGIDETPVDKTKILVEAIVHLGSKIEGRPLRDVPLPAQSLLVSIKRGEMDITPNGHTIIHGGDYLTVLTSVSKELDVRDWLESLCQE